MIYSLEEVVGFLDRECKKMSLRTIAKIVEIDAGTLSRIQRGLTPDPKFSTIIKLSQYMTKKEKES